MVTFDMHKLAFIVARARAFDTKEAADDLVDEPDAQGRPATDTLYDGSGSNPTDDGGQDALLDHGEDAGEQTLRDFLDELNDAEKLTLVALVWVGRGSFAPEEWADALAEARRAQREGDTADYLMGLPMLGDLLAEGAAAMGRPLEADAG